MITVTSFGNQTDEICTDDELKAQIEAMNYSCVPTNLYEEIKRYYKNF